MAAGLVVHNPALTVRLAEQPVDDDIHDAPAVPTAHAPLAAGLAMIRAQQPAATRIAQRRVERGVHACPSSRAFRRHHTVFRQPRLIVFRRRIDAVGQLGQLREALQFRMHDRADGARGQPDPGILRLAGGIAEGMLQARGRHGRRQVAGLPVRAQAPARRLRRDRCSRPLRPRRRVGRGGGVSRHEFMTDARPQQRQRRARARRGFAGAVDGRGAKPVQLAPRARGRDVQQPYAFQPRPLAAQMLDVARQRAPVSRTPDTDRRHQQLRAGACPRPFQPVQERLGVGVLAQADTGHDDEVPLEPLGAVQGQDLDCAARPCRRGVERRGKFIERIAGQFLGMWLRGQRTQELARVQQLALFSAGGRPAESQPGPIDPLPQRQGPLRPADARLQREAQACQPALRLRGE